MPPTALVLVLTPGKRDDVVLIPEVAAWAERQGSAPEVVLITQGSPVHLAALASEHGLEYAEVRPAIEPYPSPRPSGVSSSARGPFATPSWAPRRSARSCATSSSGPSAPARSSRAASA